MAAVALQDYVKPFIKLSPRTALWTSKVQAQDVSQPNGAFHSTCRTYTFGFVTPPFVNFDNNLFQ